MILLFRIPRYLTLNGLSSRKRHFLLDTLYITGLQDYRNLVQFQHRLKAVGLWGSQDFDQVTCVKECARNASKRQPPAQISATPLLFSMEVTDRFDTYIVEQITILEVSPDSVPPALPSSLSSPSCLSFSVIHIPFLSVITSPSESQFSFLVY